MASRRPALRLLAQCKSRNQLSSSSFFSPNWASRRALSSFPSSGASSQTPAPLRYLGWAAVGLLVAVPLTYKMVWL
jgi:coproporphyrinogen III oxidase